MNKSFLLIILFFIQVQILLAQSNKIVLNEHFKQTPLQEVLNILEKKYQLKLSYEHQAIQDIYIDKKIKEAPLSDALQVIFEPINLEFQLVNEQQLLIRKKAPPKEGELVFIRGKIIDDSTKEPLAYASILANGQYGTESNDSGAFELELPFSNSMQIQVQYVGYQVQTIAVDSQDFNRPIAVQLQTQSLEIASVTIVEQTPSVTQNTTNGAITTDVSALNRLPTFVGGNDVLRNIQMLPGISAHDDLSAELSIRGSNGDENMMIMDGITLYNVGHYFGIFSAINPNIANKVTVYKNAFPAEFGGRTAGVVDITTNELLQAKIHGGVEANLLTSNAWLELPLGKKMGLLIGGRITNKDIADTPFFDLLNQKIQNPQTSNDFNNPNTDKHLTSIEPNFKFNDVNAKWTWQITPKTSATASLFRGFDHFDYDIEQELKTKRDQLVINNVYEYSEEVNWKNQGASLQLEHHWTNYLNTQLLVSNSSYLSEREVTNSLSKERPNTVVESSNKNEQYNGINAWKINFKNDWTVTDNQLFTFGYHLVDSEVNIAIDVNENDVLSRAAKAQQHAFFLQHNALWFDQLKVHLGLRNTYYSETKKMYVSPRISAAYHVNDVFQIKGAWSYYHQFLRQSYHEDRFGRVFDFWVLGGKANFPIAHSKNTMLGFRFLQDWFDLDVEFYQKNATGVIEHALEVTGFEEDEEMVTTSQNGYKVFSGTGLTRGMDILLKKTRGAYTGWIAYTLSKSTNRFPQIRRNAAFPSQNDRRHQLKIINQYQWRKWDFSATYVFSSGRPYTDLFNLSDASKDRDEISPEDRISYLDSYHRIDIGVDYNFKLGTAKAQIGASVFNLLNRKNVKYQQYIYSFQDRDEDDERIKSTVIGTELDMLGITPNVRLKVEF